MPAPASNSLIDRVDRDDRPVGTVERGQVLRLGANFRTVHVFVFHERRLLLQRLSGSRERNPGRWGSSVAAYLYTGEDYEKAAHRRLAEELGIDGPLQLVGKTRMRDEDSLKFIELFTMQDGPAAICEPAHIEGLRLWDPKELEDAIEAGPESFTPTFLHVYRYFRRQVPSRPA